MILLDVGHLFELGFDFLLCGNMKCFELLTPKISTRKLIESSIRLLFDKMDFELRIKHDLNKPVNVVKLIY